VWAEHGRQHAYNAATSSADSSTNTEPPEFANPTRWPDDLAHLELTVTSLRLLRSESRSAAGALASVADAYGVVSVARVLQRG
jgi:hypothetical protein